MDGRIPRPSMKLLPALSALSGKRARGAAGPAISLGRRGAARDLIEKGCPTVVAATRRAALDTTNGQAQGAPGAKQTAADESLRCAAPTRSEETPAPEL